MGEHPEVVDEEAPVEEVAPVPRVVGEREADLAPAVVQRTPELGPAMLRRVGDDRQALVVEELAGRLVVDLERELVPRAADLMVPVQPERELRIAGSREVDDR